MLCYTVNMNEWYPFLALAALLIGLFTWLRQDIKEQGKRIDEQGRTLRQDIKEQGKHIDEQGRTLRQDIKEQSERITGLIADVAALKATIETFFRVRVDPNPPDPEHRDRAA